MVTIVYYEILCIIVALSISCLLVWLARVERLATDPVTSCSSLAICIRYALLVNQPKNLMSTFVAVCILFININNNRLNTNIFFSYRPIYIIFSQNLLANRAKVNYLKKLTRTSIGVDVTIWCSFVPFHLHICHIDQTVGLVKSTPPPPHHPVTSSICSVT